MSSTLELIDPVKLAGSKLQVVENRLAACEFCPHRRGIVCHKANDELRQLTERAVRLSATCPVDSWKWEEAKRRRVNGNTVVKELNDYPKHDICAVACYFNPVGWKSLRQNYIRFVRDMKNWDIPLFVAEVAFEDQEFVDPNAFMKLRANRSHILWQKERLLNELVTRLPAQYTKIAWIDADVLFLDTHWVELTCCALDNYPVVQLWGNWYHSDGNGTLHECYGSIGHLGNNYMTAGGHPGGAWGAHRSIFPLYDAHILGGGDSIAIESWVGMTSSFTVDNMEPHFKSHYQQWSAKAFNKVRGRVTALPCGATHLYHGSRTNRRYASRWEILRDGEYDPKVSIKIDQSPESFGLYQFANSASNKLVEAVHGYFTGREEDDASDRLLPKDWFNPNIQSRIAEARSHVIAATTIEVRKDR